MANKSKYAEMGKDALTSEVKARRAGGRKISVDLRGDEDTLRAALDTDDLENGEFPSAAAAAEPEPPKVEEPTPKLAKVRPANVKGVPALHNQIARQADAPASAPTQPSEEEWSGGEHHQHKGDGFVYEVVKRDADAFNKPVKARVPKQESGHPGLYWEGSEEEFAANFVKV